MSQIKGTNVIAPVVPLDTTDVHPSHEARYGKGGYRTAATTAERDAIPAARREAGMLVYVQADETIYQLGEDLTTWSELETGGGGGGVPDAHASTHGAAGSDPVTVTIAQVSGLETALDGKQASGSYAALNHTHVIGDVTGLQTALNGKAATTHTHVIADVTGLQNALDGKQAAGSYAAASHTHDFTQVTDDNTYTNFLPEGGSLATALSGIDSALGDRALASDFDQGVKTTDSPSFFDLDVQNEATFVVAYVSTASFPSGPYFCNLSATTLTDTRDIYLPNSSGTLAIASEVAALSHAHSATADLTFAGATAGQVLTVNSGATALVWATPTTYTLPQATGSTLGGITVSTGLSVASGALSVSYGTTSGTACQGNDARLSDARTPTAHNHAASDINSGVIATARLAASGTASASTYLRGDQTWSSIPAGGSTNVWIPASAFIPRTTNGCGVDSRETATNRTNWDELLFDAGADEFAQAAIIMPSNYNAGTFTARFYWTASGATDGSDDVIWGIQARAFANDDALDTAFGTAQTVTDTVIATNDMHASSATSAVTAGGTPAANVPLLIQIYRDADAAGDTYGHDARLLGVEIIYTAA